jgi:hypothetical protein
MEIWNLCAGKVGALYDWLYYLGWLLRIKIEDPVRFVCHELIDWAFRKAGRPLFNTGKPHFLTPQHFHLMKE